MTNFDSVNEQLPPVRTMFYFCGGTGFNIGSQWVNHLNRNESVAYVDTVDVAFMDTSKANVHPNIPKNTSYFVEDADGAGSDRGYIYPIVRPHIKQFLDRHEPAQFNVVVFSGGGGSGSVIGPLVIAELLAAKIPTVAAMVGTGESLDKANNVIDTMKSLDSISAKANVPIPLVYVENVQSVPYAAIDEQVIEALAQLAILTNQKHERLDSKDVENFIHYHKKSGQIPELCRLNIETTRQAASLVQEPIAIASLYDDAKRIANVSAAFYQTTGLLRDELQYPYEQIHYVINSVGIDDIMTGLADAKAQLNRVLTTQRGRRAILDVDDSVTDSGIVI